MRGTFKVSRSKMTKAETIVSGAATITLDQSMTYAKRRTDTGSIAGDWFAVGRDVSRAISTVKREFKAA